MSYIKAHAPLIRAELVEEHDKYRQAKFTNRQAPTLVFIDQNYNSAIQKLHRLALQMGTACYRQDKSSDEIVREFFIGVDRIRGAL